MSVSTAEARVLLGETAIGMTDAEVERENEEMRKLAQFFAGFTRRNYQRMVAARAARQTGSESLTR